MISVQDECAVPYDFAYHISIFELYISSYRKHPPFRLSYQLG